MGHTARLEREMVGTVKQAQETRRELRETGARLEREIFGIMEQALHKAPMLTSPTDRKQASQINVDGSCGQSPHRAAGRVPPMEPAREKTEDVDKWRSPSTMGEPEGRGVKSSFWVDYMRRFQRIDAHGQCQPQAIRSLV